MTRRLGLAGSLAMPGLWVLAVAASAPMVVTVGGIPPMYAATGLDAVPAAFLVLGLALLPVTVAIMGAARHLGHAATMYALLAAGWGRVAGVAAGTVALATYAAIGFSLYGLLGAVAVGVLGGSWWIWALIAWCAVALLGRASLPANVLLIGAGLAIQVVVLVGMVRSALDEPAAELGLQTLNPVGLLAHGASALGAVLVLCVAGYVGFESPASYVEETRHARVLSATSVLVVLSLAVGYAVVAWAIGVGYGAATVQTARDPGSGMPLSLLGSAAPLGTVALVLAIGMSMLSFHHLTTRYLFRLGYEGVLPTRLGLVGRSGAPWAASVVNSTVALAVVATAALLRLDPFTGVFVPLSTLAAIGLLVLFTAGSWAAGRYFAEGGGTNEGVLVRRLAPTLGVAASAGVLALVVTNLDLMLGVEPGAVSTWLLPGVVVLVALAGCGLGFWLRRARPAIYERIGVGTTGPADRLDPRLVEMPL